MATSEKPTPGTTRPTPAELWNQHEPPKPGRKIAPIWIVLGLSLVMAGILFGQMFAPSNATAADSAVTPAPAPSVTATPYGEATPEPIATDEHGSPIRRLHGAAQTQPTPSAPPSTPDPETQQGNIDRAYANSSWPSVSQLVTEQNSVPDVNAPSVSASSSPGVVTVYTREAATPNTPAVIAQNPPPVNQTATTEGDNTGRLERGGTELERMPSEVVTPAPVTVPAGSRVSMTFDVPQDSDLSGPFSAHLNESVCDPRTGELAWPEGSTALGYPLLIQSGNQRHLAFSWDWMRFPNLTRRSLLGSVITEDEEGHTGITGRRNAHTWSIFRDSVIGSIANSAGQILSNLTAKVGAQAPIVVVPQNQAGGGATSTPIDIPTIELGRSVTFELVLMADYTADRPYDEPGWHGCRS